MLSKLMGLGSGWQAAIVLAVIGSVASGGFYFGYEYHEGKVAQEELEKRNAIEAKLQMERKRNAHLAAMYLDAAQKRRVEYREKIVEVPTYVNSGDCELNDVGVQNMECLLDPSRCTAGADAKVSR